MALSLSLSLFPPAICYTVALSLAVSLMCESIEEEPTDWLTSFPRRRPRKYWEEHTHIYQSAPRLAIDRPTGGSDSTCEWVSWRKERKKERERRRGTWQSKVSGKQLDQELESRSQFVESSLGLRNEKKKNFLASSYFWLLPSVLLPNFGGFRNFVRPVKTLVSNNEHKYFLLFLWNKLIGRSGK